MSCLALKFERNLFLMTVAVLPAVVLCASTARHSSHPGHVKVAVHLLAHEGTLKRIPPNAGEYICTYRRDVESGHVCPCKVHLYQHSIVGQSGKGQTMFGDRMSHLFGMLYIVNRHCLINILLKL